MPATDSTFRRLPITPPPIHRETLGSYLNRLAIANNRPRRTFAALLGPLPIGYTPASDSTAGWTPRSPHLLATLAGRPPEHLARALPALADFLTAAPPRPTPTVGRSCLCCAARRGASTALVIVHIAVHHHICLRHQRWTRASHDIPIDDSTAVVAAQHGLERLSRRHDARHLHRSLLLARTIAQDWATSDGPEQLQKRWHDRILRLQARTASRNASAADRLHIASFPEIATLTDLLIRPPHPALDAKTLYVKTTAELAERCGFSYPSLGIRDPLYRRFCASQVI